jgi:hypothetical protein
MFESEGGAMFKYEREDGKKKLGSRGLATKNVGTGTSTWRSPY